LFQQIHKEELKVPAHTDYLADLRDFVVRLGRKYAFSEKMVTAFKLAVDEASTNIMRHAYREAGGEGFILIRALVRKTSVTICLIDQGKFFDPTRVKDPDLDRYVQIGKKGGLGIFMMRKLMDEIDYRKTEEGNQLRLTKNRESSVSAPRKLLAAPLKSAVHAIPFSIKAKYWLRSCSILIAGVILAYCYYHYKASETEFVRFVARLNEIDVATNRIFDYKPDLLIDAFGGEVSAALKEIYEENRDVLSEVALVDSLNYIVGHNNPDLVVVHKLAPPVAGEQAVDKKIQLYEIEQMNGESVVGRIEVYDVISKLNTKGEFPEKRELHIRAPKSYVDQRISTARWEYVRLAVSVGLLGCVGSFMLVYILTAPMRRLAEWVRRADHGEIGDEMDIDASTEIGEIAHAFSEITTKFRQSQKNLVEQEQLQKEMQVAQEIQQTLLPSDFPDLDGYELNSYYEAARTVGGDYYDFVEVDKDTLGVVVADVSGKGVPGSLVMTMIRQALRTEARGVKDAAEVLARVNKTVMGDVKKGMFVTLFYVIIDSKRRRLNYASAGHNPMILFRPSTKKTYYLNPRGFPVGIQLPDNDLFRKSIESDTIQLSEDDILLLYTDGITEAMNARRDLFGEERLLKTIREFGHLRVKPFVEKIKDEILAFTEGEPQSDDITLVTIKEKTSPEKEEMRRAKEAHKMIAEGQSIREACEAVGITTYAYYNKYKKEFEENGENNAEADSELAVDAKHIAIEDKVKIFDIIKNHPEYGAKRISEELNAEVYGFTHIPENKIYDELVRNRLNTKQLREGFVSRGGRTKRPMKPPGTPLLTLSGEVILDRSRSVEPPHKAEKPLKPAQEKSAPRPEKKEEKTAVANEAVLKQTGPGALPRQEVAGTPVEIKAPAQKGFGFKFRRRDEGQAAEKGRSKKSEREQPKAHEPAFAGTKSPAPSSSEINFEDLFAGGTILEAFAQNAPASGEPSPTVVDHSEFISTTASADEIAAVSDPATEKSGGAGEDNVFSAVDDLLRNEIDFSFGGEGEAHELAFGPFVEASHVEEVVGAEAAGLDYSAAEPAVEAGETQLPFVEVSELLEYATGDAAGTTPEAGFSTNGGEPNLFADEASDFSGEWADQRATAAEVYENGKNDAGVLAHDNRTSAGFVAQAQDEPSEDEREQLLIAGLRHYKLQNFDDAIREFRIAIARYPNFKEAHSILGNAYFRNRMFDEAATSYRRVKELDPADTTAFENMGVIHANRGEYLEAMREWQRVLEIDPGRDDIRRKIELAARMMMKRPVHS